MNTIFSPTQMILEAEVSKSHPVPGTKYAGNPANYYNASIDRKLQKLEVGDSMFFPLDDEGDKKCLQAAFHRRTAALSVTFVSRTVRDNGVYGLRVWRKS